MVCRPRARLPSILSDHPHRPSRHFDRALAEQRIGTCFPVRQADGTRRLVEVWTPSPWNNPPPRVGEYTTEEEIRQILRSVDIEA
jgi:hypothetical protein